MTVAVLALIAAGQLQLSEYLVEEAFTILLGVAALLVSVLLTVIAFLFLWQGATLAVRWLKAMRERLTGVCGRRSGAGQRTSRPLPGH
jgi:membrane protein implicated in regulation of membrane protease activity